MYSGELEAKLRQNRFKNVRRVTNRYVSFRTALFSKLAFIVSLALRLLPIRLVAMIKARLILRVKMPYPKSVVVDVDSHREIRRAGFCFREPETVEWLEECAKKGGTLYDVGANIGAVSLLYAANIVSKYGELPAGSVLSFEPGFSTFSKLCKNIVINNWGGGILPFSSPLSNKVGSDVFSMQTIESGSSGHSLSGSKDCHLSYQLDFPVITSTIDHLHYELGFPAPKWIKIDVDGHDYEVLLGAERVISDGHVKSVLIEKNEKETEIRAFMQQYGFLEKRIDKACNNINLRFDR